MASAEGEFGGVGDEELNAVPGVGPVGFGLVLNFRNLVFPEYGAYQLVLLWDGNELRSPMRLSVVPLPDPA